MAHNGRIVEAHDAGLPLPDRLIRLPTGLRAEDLHQLCAAFVERLENRCLAAKPEASVLLEKTLGNSYRVELINWLRPDARFLHVIRDGREVAGSLTRLSSSWGARWAPDDPARAARYGERPWRTRAPLRGFPSVISK